MKRSVIQDGRAGGHRLTKMALRIALVLVSTALAFAAAEGAVRGYFYTRGVGRHDIGRLLKESGKVGPEKLHGGTGLYGLIRANTDRNSVYELRPDQVGIYHRGHVATNSFGLRGHEITLQKPPGTFRIVGIGDSHMFGAGVDQEEIYMARLEVMLNEVSPPGRRFEVLNFGTPGYNTVMEVSTFEHRALRFDPDLVLVHFIGNDLHAPHFLESSRSWDPRDWFLTELGRAVLGFPESPEEQKAAESRRYRYTEYPDLSGPESFEKAMEHLRDLCAERQLPVIFMVVGESGSLREFVIPVARRMGFRILQPQPAFAAYLEARGIEPRAENWSYFFRGNGSHPNAEGHAAYAEALLADLTALGIVPRTRPGQEPAAPAEGTAPR